jgi:crotonobetainyl-CoA:carnitine CoA-transferase CaiB-like acyl-CoA transferase
LEIFGVITPVAPRISPSIGAKRHIDWAYHGADVLNIRQPLDFEIDQMYFTSSVGMRSSILDLKRSNAVAKLKELIAEADIFFANRRPGYINQFKLTAEDLAQLRPGIIHVNMSLYGPTGPWARANKF